MAEFLRKRKIVLQMFSDMGASKQDIVKERLLTLDAYYVEEWFSLIV